jgi:regulator of sigma E protease
LIFVHELGHFIVAKRAGVTVLRFSLGFGPRLVGIKRGDTDYCLSAIPFGGYVKMLGEEADEEITEDQMAGSFANQPVTKRIAIVLAGPLSNFLLAVVIFSCIYALSGIPQLTAEIGSISPGSPAEQAGLLVNDRVAMVNDRPVSYWEEFSKMIEEHGEHPLTLRIDRSGESLQVEVTPRVTEVKNIFGEPIKRPVIGVTAAGKYTVNPVNPFHAVYYSLLQTWNLSKLFVVTIGKLFEGVVSFKTLGGPILIAQMAGQQASEGILNLIHFIALISVNLAVLNLLPIPVLDGGHILFFAIEGLLGRPIGEKKIEWAQRAGMVLLIALMVFVFYNDIMRLIPGNQPDFLP